MKKKKRTIPIFSIIIICFGIAFFVMGITGYIQQLGQRDWSVATATVINVDKRTESGGGRHGHRSHRTVYDILYQYEANGNVYTGEIVKSNAPKKLGETLEIKFDPDAPENSTKYLEPSPGFLVSGIIALLVSGLIAFRIIRQYCKKNKTGLEFRAKDKSEKNLTPKLTDVTEIRQKEDLIFHEVCEMVRKLKQKHPSVGYVVRLECSENEIELDSGLPNRYSAWIFVSLNRNRTILESGRGSGEWPGACDEIIQVKSFFGKNKKLIVSDTYKSLLAADLEVVTDEYEASYSTYVENKEASDEILENACCVEWID